MIGQKSPVSAVYQEGELTQASAESAGIGLAASNVRYSATVKSAAPQQAFAELLRETDAVAEVHNTLRKGVAVKLLA